MDPAVIGGVIKKVRDLRGCEKAREANECTNGELGGEDIEGVERELLYLSYPVQYLPPGGNETGGRG